VDRTFWGGRCVSKDMKFAKNLWLIDAAKTTDVLCMTRKSVDTRTKQW